MPYYNPCPSKPSLAPLPPGGPVPIPKVYSRPQHANRWSFLKVPAEIRNNIYRHLLSLCEPIVVQIPEDFCGCKSRSYVSTAMGRTCGLQTRIFQTCCQVYHETIGIMYGDNTFRLTSGSIRHHGFHRDCSIMRCVYWTAKLGLNIQVLKRIVLDSSHVHRRCFDNSCTKGSDYHIDMLRLMGLVWANKAITITFICMQEDATDEGIKRATVLSNLLHSIGNMDTMSLRKYQRLLGHVGVENNCMSGCIVYRSTNYTGDVCTELEVRNDGKTIFQVPQPHPPQLSGLTGEILPQVIGYVVAKQKAVYDLVNGTTSGLDNSLSRVNRRMRNLYHDELKRHADNTIVLRSTSKSTSSAIFEPLWKRVRSVGRHSWETCDPIGIAKTSFNMPKIILDLQGADYAATSSISLDSWEICRATCHFKSSTPIIFRLTGFDHGSHVDHHTTVGHIRHRTFGLLVSLSRSLSTKARNACYVAVEVCGPGTSFEAVTMEHPGDSQKKFVPKEDIAREFEVETVYKTRCTSWQTQDLKITHKWIDMPADDWPDARRGKLSSFLEALAPLVLPWRR